jgi:hypothetical protein
MKDAEKKLRAQDELHLSLVYGEVDINRSLREFWASSVSI